MSCGSCAGLVYRGGARRTKKQIRKSHKKTKKANKGTRRMKKH